MASASRPVVELPTERSPIATSAMTPTTSAIFDGSKGLYDWWNTVIDGLAPRTSIEAAISQSTDLGISYLEDAQIDWATTQINLCETLSKKESAIFFEVKPPCTGICTIPAGECPDIDCSCRCPASYLRDLGEMWHIVRHLFPMYEGFIGDVTIVSYYVVSEKKHRLQLANQSGVTHYESLPSDEFNEFAADWNKYGRISTCVYQF